MNDVAAKRQESPAHVRRLSRLAARRGWVEPGSPDPIILTGSEDGSHPRAAALKARIPGCEMKILYGAGHACQIEQPWLFDRYMLAFLKKNGLFPATAASARSGANVAAQ